MSPRDDKQPDRLWAVRQPFMPTAHAPERLLAADYIEVRVTLTPLQWNELDQRHERSGEQVGGACHFAQIEARDHRALFYITRQLIDQMFKQYMGIDLK